MKERQLLRSPVEGSLNYSGRKQRTNGNEVHPVRPEPVEGFLQTCQVAADPFDALRANGETASPLEEHVTSSDSNASKLIY